ncbi:MAG: hypothetical protein WBC59_09585 [Phycisphaerae bacterium]
MGKMQTEGRGRGRLGPAVAIVSLAAAVGLAAAGGCAAPIRFPAAPIVQRETRAGLVRAYDTDADGHADYFTTQNGDGRTVQIAYDTNGDAAPDTYLNLDQISVADCRHIVIILDGVPFDLAKRAYGEGRLRLFHPPVRLIAPFPSMTDVALADVFGTMRCLGYEALFYDHKQNRLTGGDSYYLDMKNEPWTPHLDYRAGTVLDALGYLYPRWTFDEELKAFKNLFNRRDRKDLAVYFVSTAGIGSREGEEGLRRCVDEIDHVIEELVWQARGLVKFTLLADHGHTLKRCERVDFRKFLRERGWHVTDRLAGPRDVAPIEYGLVTYASFATRDKERLGADLLQHSGVEFVAYAEGEKIVVENSGGKAFFERRGGRYRYRTDAGDPLGLKPILEQLKAGGKVAEDGFADDATLFNATALHRYPDPLDRLWRAFHGLAEHVPDVVASLNKGHCAGAADKSVWLPYMASTHGDLEQSSSTTFIMSTAGPLDGFLQEAPAFRSRDVSEIIEHLTGRPWPPPCERRRP